MGRQYRELDDSVKEKIRQSMIAYWSTVQSKGNSSNTQDHHVDMDEYLGVGKKS